MTRYNLSFAGAGRVADALCREIHKAGHKIIQVVSPTEKKGRLLAESCSAVWSQNLDFNESNDLIIVAVPDHNLKEVLLNLTCPESTAVVHTAGSFGLEAFPCSAKSKGVLYPLQTFSAGRSIDFRNLPFLLESSSPMVDKILENLVSSIGASAYRVGTKGRRMLHLSAVFVCNFTNFMLTSGKDLSARAGMSFSILEPLIKETISKALENGPENSQTGPAVRKDLVTIEKHMDLLSFSPELQKIYRDVTEAIQEYYNKKVDD